MFCIEPPNHVHAVWDCGYIPRNGLINIWRTVTGNSFEVYITKIDEHHWRGAVSHITKYITKISDNGAGMRGMHLIGSWGNVDSRRIRMKCRKCGSYFSPLWDLDYAVEEFVGFEYAEVDRG